MPTVLEVITEAREVFLNDTAAELFTNTALLPFVKRAYDELQNKLALNGHQIGEEVSANIDVPASDVPLVLPSLPSDIIEPISLEERLDGSVSEDDWEPMERVRILGSDAPTEKLMVWDWAENTIKLRGSTSPREVRLRYTKFQSAIVDTSTSLPIINCKPFLSARVAALAAGHIGGNEVKAGIIQTDAVAALNDLLGISTKSEQANSARRRPFRR